MKKKKEIIDTPLTEEQLQHVNGDRGNVVINQAWTDKHKKPQEQANHK